MKPDVAEFLMGHIIDKMGYNQVYNDEEYVRMEWLKVAGYVDSGLSSEAQGKIIELETVKNATLTQIQIQQKQLAALTESLRQSLVMQVRETVKLNELEKNQAKKKERQERIDQLEQQIAALDKAAEAPIQSA
jgi:mannitol-specific phosphotransferase system IIBC component